MEKSEQKAIEKLEKMRWNGKPTCVYCNSAQISKHTEHNRKSRLQCSACKKSFSVTTGTIFHHSHVSLSKWFKMIDILSKGEKVTVTELAKELNVRVATAWSMRKRIKFNNEISGFRNKLLISQKSLGSEFEKVLFDNLWDLYEK